MHSKIKTVAFIGSAGIPNRYGGFEAFLEHTAPEIVGNGFRVTVTCDAALYPSEIKEFKGVNRIFINCPANGAFSIVHDLLAFFLALPHAKNIIALGVSGGVWFPIFRLICTLTGRNLLVNVDGIEWKRGKFSAPKKLFLWLSDYLAQLSAHKIIIDNHNLPARHPGKTKCIAYPGDYVPRTGQVQLKSTALTVCRIEPENNIEMLIKGFLGSTASKYTIIGNWDKSQYGIRLREKYSHNDRLNLLDPIYDAKLLAEHRESCSIYIHGHSVGGTNPSLVEMIFYDADLFCFDISFHRSTLNGEGNYFTDANDLALKLNSAPVPLANRETLRSNYSRANIAREYIELLS